MTRKPLPTVSPTPSATISPR